MIGLGSDKKKEKAARKQKYLQRRKETTQRNFQEPIKEEVGSEHNEQGINMEPMIVKKVKEEISNYFDMDFEQGTIMMPIYMKEESMTENKENCKQEKNTEAMDDSDHDVPLAVRK